ncbi:FHA domain-containing protein [Curtobacterium sp. MCJR17_020]|uniref:FHA domain-containing protein n=1 Tax=Curtobacterium sp. MCJR17_020 TaxID=2175619 RepID=UPI0011B619C5|nr:FHA domain-containing protein [Curtobacterium sp. MCJR17_020]WIE70667.1 FHA domain-containing protein [Curtobacterium sp. MCJR17_020]
MTAGASRRPVAPTPVEQAPPPPLQQPDSHGRRSDPAADAWLPESTLDPATRAWLTGADRRSTEPPAAVPVQRPDDLAPREAPSHVHGAGSGLGDWSNAAAQPDAVPAQDEPPLDPDAYRSEPADALADDPERTRLAPVEDRPVTAPAADEAPAPVWAPPVAPAPSAAPAGPSWWVGRGASTEAAQAASGAESAPVVPPVPSAPASTDDTLRDTPRDTEASSHATDDAAVHAETDGADDTTSTRSGEPVQDGALEQSTAAVPVVSPPQPGDTAVVEPLIDRRPPRPAPLVTPGMHATTICHVCGNRLEPDDIFCGECGAVRPAVTAAFTGPVVPLPMARPDWATEHSGVESAGAGGSSSTDVPDDEIPADATADDQVTSDQTGSGETGSDGNGFVEAVADETAADDESALPDSEASRPGGRPRGAHAAPVTEPTEPSGFENAAPHGAPQDTERSWAPPEQAPHTPLAAPLPPIPGAAPELPFPPSDRPAASADADELDEDVDETRIVSKTPTRAPFLLHFSTGERFGVHGTGLLGRLPRPQPGERYDDLLTVHDPGKSVSKTHLELGRDGDDLWVSDRFSGNGTVVRHIDGSIRRCEPGRRYRVERGARVDIGEQFFLVQ